MRLSVIGGFIFIMGVIVGVLISKGISSQNCAPEVASTERKPDSIEPTPAAPYLNAPVFLHPGVLNSDQYGHIYVAWRESAGAVGYEVKVFNEQGSEAKSYRIKRNITSVKGLHVDPKAPQTPYKIQVIPIGPNEERGQPSEVKEAAMLPMRNIAPPSIKRITTEE